MRVVILRIGTSDFGRIGTYNVQEVGLAKSLIKMGHQVSVLYLIRPVKTVVKDETYDFVYYLPHKTIGMHGIFDVSMMEEFNPERVIVWCDNQLWSKNVIIWCKKRNIPCVCYFGAVLSNQDYWLNQLYTKLILMRNRRSFNYSINCAKTEAVKEEMIRLGLPFHRVINVGLDETILSDKRNMDLQTRNELGFSDKQFVLLFIGRLIDYKRPFLACDITTELRNRGYDAQLIIIGKGKLEKELEEYIALEDKASYIQWKKRIPYEEIYKYMISADCCINLSAIEIFGMTILEAMYYGLPVVAQEAPGPNIIIENNKSGLICDIGDDPKAWADKVLYANDNRVRFSKEAHRRVCDTFVWDKIAVEFL